MSGGFQRAQKSLVYLLKLPDDTVDRVFRVGDGGGLGAAEEKRKWKVESAIMEGAHVFDFPQELGQMMAMTDNDFEDVHLPFPATFLDVPFQIEAAGSKIGYVGVLLTEAPDEFVHDEMKGRITAVAFGEAGMGNLVWDVCYPVDKRDEKLLKLHRYGQVELRTLRNITANFLTLLDSKEVVLVETHSSARRERKGKAPCAARTVVRLSQTLKRYVAEFQKEAQEFHYSHRFWVRGHWRRYSAERYVKVSGEVQWIRPFVKGDRGLLVQKTYEFPSGGNSAA